MIMWVSVPTLWWPQQSLSKASPPGHLCLVICQVRLMLLPLPHRQDSAEVQRMICTFPGNSHMREGYAPIH